MPSNPLILAFDTSAAHCAAALLSGDQILAQRAESLARGQAQRLMPFLEEILADATITWSDLTALGVGIGPGNFTGIRISVSAARGMSLALGIPAVGVSTFEATSVGHPYPHVATVPAPRAQVYALETTPDAVLGSALDSGLNSGPALVPQEIVTSFPILTPPQPAQLAANIGIIALARFATNTSRPAPLYVRAADAAPPRDAAPKIL